MQVAKKFARCVIGNPQFSHIPHALLIVATIHGRYKLEHLFEVCVLNQRNTVSSG